MTYTEWGLASQGYAPEKRQSRDALFTVGNGYFGIRGFFEEDTHTAVGNGGIYVAGVFGAGSYDAWEGKSRELCSITNLFRLILTVDGQTLDGVEDTAELTQTLDMRKALYRRRYVWSRDPARRLEVCLERFADRADVHRAGQRLTLRALDAAMDVDVSALLDSDVRNLNWESCEPLPVQPGRDHIVRRTVGEDWLATQLDDPDATVVYAAQNVCARVGEQPLDGQAVTGEKTCGRSFHVTLSPGEPLVLEKIVYVCTTKDEDVDCDAAVRGFLASPPPYAAVLDRHIRCWEARWRDADIRIDAANDDQTALRYNLFELMCACPEHTERLSIGGRGLSGEMYEGCVFWDNEIFQLPFFIFTNPTAARRLLAFRYHTLDAARRHAANNWFAGAMYPWQVSERGIEQTPRNGGAYYAIHIVADIAYAVRQYVRMTGDEAFLWDMGAEILTETARFWSSRCDYSEQDGRYHIRAVRGPNEYDVFVNDNAYTNAMARLNLRTAAQVLRLLESRDPAAWQALRQRLRLESDECGRWETVAAQLHIPYDREKGLVEEDDAYMLRRPLDLKRAKPTAKRIIDSTMPYEALPLYQVTKQSDVVTLMCLLPEEFSQQEREAAYRFYEPRTAHDSSLSYAPYGWLAARIGLDEEAYRYFTQCAYLDIADTKLNTVSGLHYANFGGTWQAAVFGFAGLSLENGVLHLHPRLPAAWNGLHMAFRYRGTRLEADIRRDRCVLTAEDIRQEIPVCIGTAERLLSPSCPAVECPLE